MDLLTHLHPAIVHFPIALLLLGSVTALVYLYRPSLMAQLIDLRRTTWFLLGLGWIAVVPAVLSGLLAQSPLPPDAPYRLVLNWHTATGLGLLILYGLLLYQAWLFQGAKARKRRAAQNKGSTQNVSAHQAAQEVVDLLDNLPSRRWLTLALAVGILLTFSTGWNGGLLVYEWGVNVVG